MNDKATSNIGIIIFVCILVGYAAFSAGLGAGKGASKAELDRVTKELSDIQIINKELSDANNKHLETIQRIQGLTDDSSRHIQLLESGIAGLKEIGEAKDIRVAEAERRFRELQETVGRLESKIDQGSERIAELLKRFGVTNESDLDRVDSNSGLSGSGNIPNYYKIAEEYRWQY